MGKLDIIKNSIIGETFNRILGKKTKYKLVAYVNIGEEKITDSTTIMETFEIDDFSERLAYNKAVEALTFKHGDKCGIDIRILNKK